MNNTLQKTQKAHRAKALAIAKYSTPQSTPAECFAMQSTHAECFAPQSYFAGLRALRFKVLCPKKCFAQFKPGYGLILSARGLQGHLSRRALRLCQKIFCPTRLYSWL